MTSDLGPAGSSHDVAIPADALRTLLDALPIAAAHLDLCKYSGESTQWRPDDSFGRVLAWLWRSANADRAVMLVCDYLAQVRGLSPNTPAPGSRLTWEKFQMGLPLSIQDHQLDPEGVADLMAYLRQHVPSFYGESETQLNLS